MKKIGTIILVAIVVFLFVETVTRPSHQDMSSCLYVTAGRVEDNESYCDWNLRLQKIGLNKEWNYGR